MKDGKVLLFSYGTLRNREVQMANFGRELAGREDVLLGYVRRWVMAADPEVAAMTGEAEYASVEPSAVAEDAVAGMVFEISEAELEAADRYEEAALYRRILVTLGSGERAWVYVYVRP